MSSVVNTLDGLPMGGLKRLLGLPPLLQWRKRVYRQRFLDNARGAGLFMGRYGSFEAASARLPQRLPEALDGELAFSLERSAQVHPDDYPLLFWLNRSFEIGLHSLFELGGHVGIRYYTYRRLLPMPDALRWTVWDLPLAVQRGRELAASRAPEGLLRFSTELGQASGSDILLVAGTLPFFPERLADILGGFGNRPRRILLNGIAVHPGDTFYTLSSMALSYRAYRVQAWEELQEELESAGYMCRDVWRNHGAIRIPFVRGSDQIYSIGGCYDLR